jgi:shikimate kinase
MNQSGVNLYLVGFTGTGKSTVGRAVARQLEYDFIDSDHEIEHTAGRTIAQIFAEEGEPAFRALERKFIEDERPASGRVVACGGGLVVPDGMLELLRSRGVVVCLHASLETVIERTVRSVHRPLVQGENREEKVRELYARREAIYRRTGTVILTDHRPLREITAHVARIFQREAREWTVPRP